MFTLVLKIGEGPRGNERGAIGSKSPPTYWKPWCSLLSLVLRAPVSF